MLERMRSFDEIDRRAFAAHLAKACFGVGMIPMLGAGTPAFVRLNSQFDMNTLPATAERR